MKQISTISKGKKFANSPVPSPLALQNSVYQCYIITIELVMTNISAKMSVYLN